MLQIFEAWCIGTTIGCLLIIAANVVLRWLFQ
jgi:hypothetical protein